MRPGENLWKKASRPKNKKLRSATHLSGSQEDRHWQHKSGESEYLDPVLPLLWTKVEAKLILFTSIPLPPISNIPPNHHTTWDKMAMSKPNFITASNDGKFGDREFIVSCKGRPFVILTAPQFPVPAFTMVDYNLIRDLNLRMTDMQCSKFFYGGQKMRILGKVSTTVQCIMDGAPSGTLHLKAHVVQDLYKLFDVHSVAGTKLSHKLLGPPAKLIPDTDEETTEPTENVESDAQEAKKKKRRKQQPKKASKLKATKVDSLESSSSSDDRPAPPPSTSQGRWTRHYSYDGWHPVHGYGRPDVLRLYYENTETRQVQNEMPDSWDDTWDDSTDNDDYADEYGDTYTNLSSIRFNDPGNLVSSDADTTTNYSQRLLSIVHSAWKTKLNTGQDIPSHLQHIPVPHGATWCSRDCAAALYDGESPSPLCGYNPATLPENFQGCCISCPGRWCSCSRRTSGMAFMKA